VSGWAKWAGFGADDDQIYSNWDANGSGTGIELKSTRDCGPENAAIMVANSSSTITERCSSTMLTTGSWYHVAGVYDASAHTLKLYLNGADNSGTLSGGPVTGSIKNSTANALIGARSGGSTEGFNGTLDEVRIYNRALTAAEISALYNSGAGCSN